MLIDLLVNFLVDYYFFAFILLTNGLVDVLIFVLVDILHGFLLNSFFLWFTHLFNVKKFTTLSQQPAKNCNILQRRIWTKKKAMTANNWPPCFKYKPSPTMPSPEPLYAFKYSPWPSVSTLAMFEPFFKYSPLPMALFVTFCAKADPTPDSAPVANVGRTVFAKNGRAFAAKPAYNDKNPPSVFMLRTTWRLPIFIVMPFPCA